VGHCQFPSWGLVRDSFLINERRGWRQDLGTRLGIGRKNISRLLNRVAVPSYEHYLGVVGFLEERGVRLIIELPASAIVRVDDPRRRPGLFEHSENEQE